MNKRGQTERCVPLWQRRTCKNWGSKRWLGVWNRECNEVRGSWWERPTMSWALGLRDCSLWTWRQMPWAPNPPLCAAPPCEAAGNTVPYYCQITTRRLPTILGWYVSLSSRNSQDKFHSKGSPHLCDSPHLFSISPQLIQHSFRPWSPDIPLYPLELSFWNC